MINPHPRYGKVLKPKLQKKVRRNKKGEPIVEVDVNVRTNSADGRA